MNALTIPRTGRPTFLWALLLLLAGMLLAAPAGIALAQDDTPFSEDVVTATTTANLNIRSAPSLDGEILATLPAGTLAVSYTHLTLPTSGLGEVSVVAVSLKNKKQKKQKQK